MTESLLSDALWAVSQGFHVFPVEPNAKTPIRIYQDRPKDDAPWTIKWSEVASNDPLKILEWWDWCPTANVGIACGPSGVLVVDCDVAKEDWALAKDKRFAYLHELLGPRVDGEIVYDQVIEKYADPSEIGEAFDTLQVQTRSGGLHLYYRWPTVVKASQASIVRGVLDIRCNGGERGGYVLGPGSVIDGRAYRLANRKPVRPAPPWLVELCRDREPVRATLGRSLDTIRQPRNQNWSGLVETVRMAPEGNRNMALFWAARSMCADGATEEECAELLGDEYVSIGGPGGQRQAEATIRSAYRNQVRKM